MQEIDNGYKFAVEVIIPLNHDRYKQYLYQFSLLEFGLFTAMSIGNLSTKPMILFFAFIGILLGIVWLIVLEKVNADIKKIWDLIEKHESGLTLQSIKIHETRSSFYPSGKMMRSIPFLFVIIHIVIATNIQL